MAARHLQKLRGDDLLQQVTSEPETSESDEDTAGPANPFDLLDEAEQDNGDDAEEPESADQQQDVAASVADSKATERTVTPPAQQLSQPQSPETSAKKKKKRAKQKAKKATAQAAPSDSATASTSAAASTSQSAQFKREASAAVDNIRLLEQNVQQLQGEKTRLQHQLKAPQADFLLGVKTNKLKADDEMRRIFGSKVVDAEARSAHAGGLVGGSRRVRRLMARGLIKRAVLQPGALIKPREHWPPFQGGLTMELAGTDDSGQQLFKYAYTASYNAAQMLFEQSQASFDPNNIMALLQQHPYHVDSLLTMHELYRSMGEVAESDDMLERCLYALEMAWHPYFNIFTAKTRMEYTEPLNRPLFLALFKQMQNLSRRGLHGTALEYAKLLLGLDPQDPKGVLFCIDYLAIRAQQYHFLQQLVEQHEGDDLSQLPNFAYSTRLAEFRETTGQTADKQGQGSGFAPGGPSNSQTADGELSLEHKLAQAVMLYPVVVVRLMEKLQDKGVGKDAEWGSLLEKASLRNADDLDSSSLSHAADIFVERHHLLWKAHDVQRLLKDACTIAAQAPAEERANWECVREEMFPASDQNQYRHLRVADFSDNVSALPPEELQAAMGPGGGQAGDPGLRQNLNLNPDDDLEGFLEHLQQGVNGEVELNEVEQAQLQRLRQAANNREEMAPGMQQQLANDPDMQGLNPWAMVLRTFMPWVNAGAAPDYAQGDHHAAAASSSTADATQTQAHDSEDELD